MIRRLILIAVLALAAPAAAQQVVPGKNYILRVDGTAARPSDSYERDTNLGRYRIGADNEGNAANGILQWDWNTSRMKFRSGYTLDFNTTSISEADILKTDAVTCGTATASRFLCVDSNADITTGIRNFTIGTNAAQGLLYLNGPAAASRAILGQTAGVNRWIMYLGDGTAESGSNAGSDFKLFASSDAGAGIDVPIEIQRASAGLITLRRRAIVPDGSAASPSIVFSGSLTTGFYSAASNNASVSINGTGRFTFGPGYFRPLNDGIDALGAASLRWSSLYAIQTVLGSPGTSATVLIESNGQLAQRDGTTAQGYRLYETYTDASNYSRLSIQMAGSAAEIGTVAAGTGTARPLTFFTNNVNRWTISTSGHLLASTDNTVDIGADTATRPRNFHLAGSFYLAGTAIIGSTGSGLVLLRDYAGTSFNRLQFGGTTSSFPALKRNGAAMESKLADDSAYTTHSAAAFQTMTALVSLGGGAAPTLGTIGGSGPATAAQNTWLRMVDSTGAAFWVPAWK